MAVQNRVAGSIDVESGSSGGVTFNNGTEVNRLMTAVIGWWDSDSVGATLSGIASGGVPLTLLANYSLGLNHNAIYYLPTPPNGLQTTTATFTDIASFGLIVNVWVGVDLASPFGVVQQATAGSTAPSLTVPNVSVQDAILDALVVGPGADGVTVTPNGPNQTATANLIVAWDPGSTMYVSSARSTLIGGDSTTRGYTLSASRTWRMQAVQIKHKQFGGGVFGRL